MPATDDTIPSFSMRASAVWLRYMKDHWRAYVGGVGALFVTNATEVLFPKAIQWSIDILSGNAVPRWFQPPETGFFLGPIMWFLIVLYLLQFLGRIVWRLCLGRQTHHAACDLKKHIWNRARYLPRQRLERDLSAGMIMNVATADINVARFNFGFTIVGSVDFFFKVVLVLALMVHINWGVALVVLLPLPILPFLLHNIARRQARLHRDSQDRLGEFTEHAFNMVSTLRMQRLTQTGDSWVAKLRVAAEHYRDARYRVSQTSLLFIPATGVAPVVAIAILIVVGGQAVVSGQMTIGQFIAMHAFIMLLREPLSELGYVISEWQQGFTSLDRIMTFLNQDEAPLLRQGGVALPSKSQADAPDPVYVIDALNFSYPNNEKPIIDKFSLTIHARERIGILGPIGTGKSTLAHLLSGLEHDFTGTIALRGQDIRHYNHQRLREVISVVPQNPFLFAASVRANICVDHTLTDDEVWRYLDIAGLTDDIRKFPQGLDTALGEWGINLSGGQKQRLTLARALAQKPQILILDDCLSAVDTVTERHILTELDAHLSDATVIWIAHRASTLARCHRVIDMGTAEVAAHG